MYDPPRVIEHYLISKEGDPKGGEDRLVVGPYYFGVIDGATDKSGNDWGTGGSLRRGGEVAAEAVAEAFADRRAAEVAVTLANELIEKAARDAKVDLADKHNRPEASLAVYSPERDVVSHVGDCNFLFIGESGRGEAHLFEKPIDLLTSAVRAKVVEWHREHGIDPFPGGNDLGRRFIMPMLERQAELGNFIGDPSARWIWGIPFGSLAYSTINGLPTTLDTTPVPEWTTEIVLASDGFRDLRPTLAETLVAHENALEVDPECVDELRTTKGVVPGNISYDDMSYLRIGLTRGP